MYVRLYNTRNRKPNLKEMGSNCKGERGLEGNASELISLGKNILQPTFLSCCHAISDDAIGKAVSGIERLENHFK
jgi:hypothetical protein